MANFSELNKSELKMVAGGQSLYEQLMEKFPNGEWDGNTFYPNGKPSYVLPSLSITF